MNECLVKGTIKYPRNDHIIIIIIIIIVIVVVVVVVVIVVVIKGWATRSLI